MSVAEMQVEADPQAEARERLRLALANLRQDEARLAAVDAARDRALSQRRAARDQVDEAEAALAAAEVAERERLVNDALAETRTSSLVKPAQNALEAARSNLRRFAELEQALIFELDGLSGLSRRCERRRSEVTAKLAEIIVASPQFHALFDDVDRCWATMRGLRKVFNHLHSVTNGHLPQEFINRWQRTESLAFDVKGAVVDEAPFTAWSAALAQLLVDPENAPLPGDGRQ